ncbi:trypsin domain-containing protein [Phthorimaea operculella]|nr:trypsin domain-containing protein [Phthorimaea operculella]
MNNLLAVYSGSTVTNSILLLLVIDFCTPEEVHVDYTDLAGEAENHKQDILSFLSASHVQEKYRAGYASLLQKLVGFESPEQHELIESRRENSISSSTRRIVAGRNTSIAAVPWQVVPTALQILYVKLSTLSILEATPIRFRRIYCVSGLVRQEACSPEGSGRPEALRAPASDLSVRLGSSWKTHGGEMYDVKSSFVHPRYTSKSKSNDVGLVELYSQLRFSPRVLPIRLADKDVRLKANSTAIVSGWGKLKEGGISASYLQSTTIPTIAMKLCKRSGLDRKAIDPSSMFCAGSFTQPSPDACQGDSGGPLVYDGVQIGVVSWGLGCARGNFPGVYTRLASPVVWDWVNTHITKKENAIHGS